MSPHGWKMEILSLNSLSVMRERIADCTKKLELIGSYSRNCVHDVKLWVVLIEGSCKTTC